MDVVQEVDKPVTEVHITCLTTSQHGIQRANEGGQYSETRLQKVLKHALYTEKIKKPATQN